MNISDLIVDTSLSVRSKNALCQNDVFTVGDLMNLNEEDLFKIKNLGEKSVKEIIEFNRMCRKFFAFQIDPYKSYSEWLQVNNGIVKDFIKNIEVSINDIDFTAKTFNVLKLNNVMLLSQFVLLSKSELEEMDFITLPCVDEIYYFSQDWLREQRDSIIEYVKTELENQMVSDDYCEYERRSSDLLKVMKNPYSKEKLYEYLSLISTPIEQFDFSVRAYNCLKRKQVNNVLDLIRLYPDGFSSIRNMGKKTEDEICLSLENYFLSVKARFEAFLNGAAIEDDTLADCDESEIEQIQTIQLFTHKKYSKAAKTYLLANDISVCSLNFSVRTVHALTSNGINNFSDLIAIFPSGISSIRNLGTKSVNEIFNKVDKLLERIKQPLVAYCLGNTKALYSDEYIENLILKKYQDIAFEGLSFDQLKSGMPEELEENRIKSIIGSMINREILEYVDFRCYRIYPSFYDVLKEFSEYLEEGKKEYLLRRYSGDTLEKIALDEGITRERVRQICDKQLKRIKMSYYSETGLSFFDEDYYQYLFTNYQLDKDAWLNYIHIDALVYSYLKNTYSSGRKEAEETLNDPKIDISLKYKLQNYINRNKVRINGELIECNRSALEVYVLKTFCSNEIKFDDFIVLYNKFLKDNGLDINKKLVYSDEVIGTRTNKLSESRSCLWKFGSKLRYYDIDDGDYTELLEVLNLSGYENTEISTLKFIEDYPEIMEQYDIRDQYELHNLLKKILPNGSYNNMVFGRQPILKFGEYDRAKSYHDILMIVAPVTLEELAQYIHMENGFDVPTIMSSQEILALNQYYHNGVYSIDFKRLSENKRDFLNRELTSDFYYISEIEKLFINEFGREDLDELNPYSLKSLGFSVFSTYVIRNYPSAEQFFKKLLTENDIFDITEYKQKYGKIQMFNQTLSELKQNYEVLKFEKDQYINIRKLEKAGISKQNIIDYCESVADFVEENSFFTIYSLRNDGFVSTLDDLGFDDVFYSGLLLAYPAFAYLNAFDETLLCKTSEIKKFSKKMLFSSMLSGYSIVDIDDFIADCKEKYDVVIPNSYEVYSELVGTDFYYDPIMKRIYCNKELYYADLDD